METDMYDRELIYFLAGYSDYRFSGPQDLFQPASSPWRGHIVFADMLMRTFRPQCLVELGTYTGVSLFAFCRAVREARLATRCYAVDTWKGEMHAGFYGEDIYAGVASYIEEHYASFVHLLRMTFDEAAPRFKRDSIDILHIDGLHTYEAVRHDFDLWLPRVRPGGIVLFHDVCEQHGDFGVHKLWDEIAPQADGSFCFRHSHGLGVWRKPGGIPLEQESSVFMRTLLGDSKDDADALAALIRSFVVCMEERLRVAREHAESLALAQRLHETERAMSSLNEQRAALQENCEQLRDAYNQLVTSRSWRITRPLRDMAAWWRSLCGR